MLTKIKNKITRFTSGLKQSTIKAIKNPEMHYFSYLPVKSGFFSAVLRNFFFRNISIEKKQLRKLEHLPKDSIIVYASKYKSHFEYLFYFTRFQKMGLPYPSIGFDHKFIAWQPTIHLIKIIYSHINYFLRNFSRPDPYENCYMKNHLLDGRAGMMPLIGKKSFYKWFVKEKTDPIKYLIEIQNSVDRPVYIIPELMFFSLKPKRTKLSGIDILFGTQEKPGKLRRFFMLLSGSKKSFIEISAPLNLKKFIEQPDMIYLPADEQATAVRSFLVNQINRHRQTITGPVLKSREELKESVLTSDTLQSFLKAHAEENDIPLREVNKKSDAYLEEIAANYSSKWITAFKVVLDWLFKNLFEGITIDQKGLNKVKEMSIKAPLVLVPCHKSHLDYLILSYVFHINNMPCPHIAAGKNLSFWPMGTIFRGGGAFFMRRTFKGAELYAKIFSEYIKKLLSEGFNLELFIEGTRSRTGKLLPPKFGLLSILIDAYREKACDDLLFVPVYFGYDRVLEEDAYLHEVEGGEKKPESVGQIFKARQVLKKRYGQVYVNFHEPISLKKYIEDNSMDFHNQTRKQHDDLCNSLGYRFINSIGNVSLATPYGIVAGAILNNPKKRFTHEQLMTDIEMYMNYLESQGTWLAETLAQNRERAIKSVISNYAKRKFIDINTSDINNATPKTIYKANSTQRGVLGYYKNNSINFFISATYTSIAMLKMNTFQFKSTDLQHTYTTLMTLFDNEFVYDRETPPDYFIRKDLKAFINDGIIVPHTTIPDTYNITSAGYRKLKCFSAFLKPYLESYLVAMNYFNRYPENSFEGKTILKKTQSIGRRMFKNNEIELPESLSDISYKNAVKFFTKKGLNDAGAEKSIQYYSDTISEYLNLLHS